MEIFEHYNFYTVNLSGNYKKYKLKGLKLIFYPLSKLSWG